MGLFSSGAVSAMFNLHALFSNLRFVFYFPVVVSLILVMGVVDVGCMYVWMMGLVYA